MGCNQSKLLECPNCGSTLERKRKIMALWERERVLIDAVSNFKARTTRLACPRCNESGFPSMDEFISHVENSHSTPKKTIVCPKCNLEGFQDGAALIDHCEEVHNYTTKSMIVINSTGKSSLHQIKTTSTEALDELTQLLNTSLPRVGDKVLAMWVHTKWQYFHATICRFIPDELQYEVDWDDQDTTGRTVDYFNLALDRSPNPKDISIGSIVLFPQGYYTGGRGETKEIRWHEGRVSHIHTAEDGTKFVSGYHTKGKGDGKLRTYKGYKYKFEELNLSDLRIGPNIFDILNDVADDNDEVLDDNDINLSCSISYRPKAIKSRAIEKPPAHQ